MDLKELSALLNGEDKQDVVLAGIGNIDRRDDYLGIALLEAIKARFHDIKTINCHDMPENYTGPILALKPKIVVFLDALHTDGSTGSAFLFDHSEIAGIAASTHGLSLGVIAEYLINTCECKVYLLGIIPKDISNGTGLSSEIIQSINNVVTGVINA
jgi:hydrogenase maturation protease